MAFRFFIAVVFLLNIFLVYKIFSEARLTSGLRDFSAEQSFGAVDGDLRVTGFVDYDCGACRAAEAALIEAIKKDGRARYMPRVIPSDLSRNNARFAIAASLQGRFWGVHRELMENYRALDSFFEKELATRHGLDPEKLQHDMASGEIDGLIEENTRLYKYTRGQDLPVFIIFPDLVYEPGNKVPLPDDFLKLFREARNRK